MGEKKLKLQTSRKIYSEHSEHSADSERKLHDKAARCRSQKLQVQNFMGPLWLFLSDCNDRA